MDGNATQPQQQSLQPLNSPTGYAFSHRISGGNRRKFPEGTLVEVQTDEEDFKGVYFAATVVTPPNPPRKSGRKRSKKLYVEYQNLLAHEDGSDRLREYVNASFVRPRPPLLDTEKGFELDDVVDAFYKDGWWTGVVTRVVEGGERFVVTFYSPPDELDFGIAELRAHWDWVNGTWVRPQKQSITGLMLDVGRKVEVSFDREDFQEAWFPATILEDMGNGTFSVEYNTENTDTDDPHTNIRVDSLHIRPCPPLLKDKNFVLLEKVDAFFDLGWWSGVVTKQLENSRYQVFFKNMKCEKEFNQSELRPHMKWKDGKWFTSFQPQEPSIPSLDDGSCQHHIPETSSASLATAAVKNSMDGKDSYGGKALSSLISRKDRSEPLNPDNLKLANVTAPLKKRIVNLSDSGDALSQPRKKLKKGNLVGENKKATHDGSDKEVICSFVSPESLNNMEKSVAQTTLAQSSPNHPWEENVQRKQRNSRTPPQNVAGKSSAKIRTDESLEIDVRDKEPDTAGNTKVVTQNGNVKGETELPVVVGSPETRSSRFGILGGKRRRLSNTKTFVSVDDQKQQVNDSTSQPTKDDKHRKRGRPRRNLVESTDALVMGNAENRDISSKRKDDDSLGIREEVVFYMEASVSNQEKIANCQFAPGRRKAGRKPSSSSKISVKVRDLAGASGGKPGAVNHTVEAEEVTQLPKDEFDNEPLSKWIEGMHASSSIDGSNIAVQSVMNGDNQDNGGVLGKANEKQPESERQASGLVDRSKPESERQASGLVDRGELEIERQSSGLVNRGNVAPIEPQNSPSVSITIATVLDNATQMQSNNGTQNASLPDGVPAVASESQSLPSTADKTEFDLLDKDSDKQPENVALATAIVDDGSLITSQPQGSVEKTSDIVLDKDNENRPENGTTPAPASVEIVAVVPSEPEKLPFVKNTILWKTIESMEVFKKIPQKPHFRPLENLKESSREGLAIGCMVTFSSLVERTSRLQINDPISTIFDIKESLAELEKHGFDIRAVENCINQLLAAKKVEEKLVNDVSILDSQITEHDHEKSRIESEINEINEQITKLQKKLSLAKSAKEKEDEEIAFLQVRRRETSHCIENVKNDFEGMVSSIL